VGLNGLRSSLGAPAAAKRPDAIAELETHRQVWQKKRLLRSAYSDAWQALGAFAAPGPSLEIGCGCGNLDGVLRQCWKSDIVVLPWADLAADAMHLPFRTGALSNIVGTDVLHHLPRPLEFLREAARVLRPEGRVLLLEPYMSWLSYPAYRRFHAEPADLGGNPFEDVQGKPVAARDVNQAVPTLLFCRNRDALARVAPQLEVIYCAPRDAIVYPLSGGYSRPSLLPLALERWAWRMERLLKRLMPVIGFRLAVALRRNGNA